MLGGRCVHGPFFAMRPAKQVRDISPQGLAVNKDLGIAQQTRWRTMRSGRAHMPVATLIAIPRPGSGRTMKIRRRLT